MNFNKLIQSFQDTHKIFQSRAFQSVNMNLTLRNWIYGMYIFEYEQNGQDKANYGESLMKEIAKKLKKSKIKGLSFTNLNIFRQFYLTYPQMSKYLDLNTFTQILNVKKIENQKIQTPSEQLISAEILIKQLSFSHFVELIKCENNLQRNFYEIECIKGTWSVRELKRQMNSLLFERTGFSKNKEKLLQKSNKKAEKISPQEIIRDPYFFEFLGLKAKDVFTENELETALLTHIQDFLLELGKGFTFEARQKRISIGGEYFKIDMVFYHRILKCHVLIELKIRDFKYSDVTQLNVYLNYYKKYEMTEGDNPPIGILLCTSKNEQLVEFATEGVDNQMFISKYKIALPSKEELKKLLQSEIKNFKNLK